MSNAAGPSALNSTPDEKVRIRLLVADQQKTIVDALALALGQLPGLEVMQERPTSAIDAVDAAARLKPDVVLIDYWMPDMEGPAAVRMILARRPETKVLFMSWLHGTADVEACFEAGAVGFLPRTLPLEKVAEAVSLAGRGEKRVFAEAIEGLTKRIGERSADVLRFREALEGLTPRELQVLAVLSWNLTVKEIGEQLYISPATVKIHIHNILNKTGASTAREVVAMARIAGVIRH